jgi:hypothetical protein
LNDDVDIASQVEGVATVTVNPKPAACSASALDVPPFTDVDRIRTDPDIDACAAAETATPEAVNAAASTTPLVAGTSNWTSNECVARNAIGRLAGRLNRLETEADNRRVLAALDPAIKPPSASHKLAGNRRTLARPQSVILRSVQHDLSDAQGHLSDRADTLSYRTM